MNAPPAFWLRLMQALFRTPEAYGIRLWRHLDASAALRYELDRCDTTPAPAEVWRARMRHLSQLLPPASLIEASLLSSPERAGKPRMPEAVLFEEHILRNIDQAGNWIF